MKLTNNAIKFLLAQYRAIYKNAYFKGLVGAALVTMSVGVASAASGGTPGGANGYESWDAAVDSKENWEVTQTSTASGDNKFYNSITVKSGTLTFNNKGSFAGTIDVQKEGNLTLNGAVRLKGYENDGSDDPTGKDFLGKLNVSGKLNLTGGEGTYDQAAINAKDITLNSGSVTTLTGGSSGDGYNNWSQTVQLAGGYSGGKFEIKSGAEVNLNTDSHLVSAHGSNFNIAGKINFKNDARVSFIRATDNYNGSDFVKDAKNSILNFNGATVNVSGTSASGAAIYAGVANINSGTQIKITDGLLTLDGDLNGTTGQAGAANNNAAGYFTMNGADTTITINATKSLVVGAGKFDADAAKKNGLNYNVTTFDVKEGTIDNKGTVTVNGVMKVANGVKLTGTGAITVSGAASGVVQPKEGVYGAGSLVINDTSLNGFITGGGKLNLDKAYVEFNGNADLSGYEFHSGNNFTGANKNINLITNGASIISAKDLTLGKAAAGVVNTALTYKATDLTFSGNDSVLKTSVDLSSTTTGSIDGDAKLGASGKINITSGAYTSNGTLTMDSGSITVTGAKSSLDISSLKVATASTGKADKKSTITVTSSGSISLDGDQLTKIFAAASGSDANVDNYKGIRFVANGGGKFVVSDTVTFNFADTNTAGVLGNALDLKNGGIVEADNVVLKYGDTLGSKTYGFDVRGGNLYANTLTFEHDAKDTSGNSFFVSGTADIAKSITSNRGLIIEKTESGNAPSNAILNLATANPTDTGTIALGGDLFVSGDGASLNVNKGNWTLSAGKTLNVKGGSVSIAGTADEKASLTVDKLDIGTSGKVDVNGNLTINGTTETTGDYSNSGSLTVGGYGNLTFGNNALDFVTKTEGKDTEVTGVSNIGSTITVAQNGTVTLDFASGTTFAADALKNIKTTMFGADFKGFLNVGQADIGIKPDNNGEVTWENFAQNSNVQNNVTNNAVENAVITGVNTTSTEFKGSVGSIQTAQGQTSVAIGGNTNLNNAANGKFAADASGKPVDLNVKNNNTSLALKNDSGNAQAGNITLADATNSLITKGEGQITIASVSGSGNFSAGADTTVTGALNVGNVTVDKNLSAQSITASKGFEANANSQVTTTSGDLVVSSGKFTANSGSSINVGANTLQVKTGAFNVDNSTVTAGTLQLGAGGSVVNNATVNTTNTDITGTLSVGSVDSADLAGTSATLFTDVAKLASNSSITAQASQNSSELSVVGIKSFSGAATNEVGNISGSLTAKTNAFIALGADEATVSKLMADNKLAGKASFYLGGKASLAANQQIVVDGTAPTRVAAFRAGEPTADLTLKNAEFLVDASAATGTKAALTFANTDATISSDVDSEIVLTGNYNPNQAIYLFEDGNSGAGFEGVTLEGTVTVRSANGLYAQTFDSDTMTGKFGANVELTLQEKQIDKTLYEASTPIKEAVKGYAKAQQAVIDANKDHETGAVNPEVKPSNDLLNLAGSGTGKEIEQAARISIFGGAAQAAFAANNTTTDAIAGRFGMASAVGGVSSAQNGQGAALWVTPVYKSSESDSLASQGLNYGVDLDLFGVALGGDYTLANGVRFGAMFNVGSGSADGAQAGAGVSNDFDYYSFAVYGGYSFDKFSITGDISYTNADNDITGNQVSKEVGKISAKTDTTALSFGVTGQYEYVTASGLSLTPHAALRFTSIDLDDYTVKSEVLGNEVIGFKGDKLNIFSIPVGITVAKNFVMGDWTVKPSFDLTLTANTGDDEVGGDVEWLGVDGYKTAIKSEFLDNFTYSATAGVAVQSNSFSLGLGVNYTGSSNIDEYGISANARFVF